MRLTVPMQYPGVKSLPAELKIKGGRYSDYFPWARMRTEHPGVRERIPEDYEHYSPTLMGLGFTQTVCGYDPTDLLACQDITTPDEIPAAPAPEPASLPPVGWQGPTQVPASVNPPPPPAGYQWASVLDATGNTIAKVLAVAQGGGTATTRYGQIIAGSPVSAGLLTTPGQVSGAALQVGGLTAGLSGGTIALIAVAGIFLVMMMGGQRR